MSGSLARDSRRIPLSGSALARLLAALNDFAAPAAEGVFAQRLSAWFDWTDAISLSAALDGPGVRMPGASVGAGLALLTEAQERQEREVRRVRTMLVQAAAEVLPRPPLGGRPAAVLAAQRSLPLAEDDFTPHRQRYVACQRAMAANIAPLRSRLRASLSTVSSAMERLAVLDEAMEKVVGEREHVLLAGVPRRLEPYFERLRQEHARVQQPPRDEARLDPAPASRLSTPWLDTFRQRMHDVLLAELDLRFQPVDALLQALRTPSS